jgi:hypothetical protein
MTMESLKLRAETLLLKKFTRSAAWEGRLPAGALGLNAPAMATKGHMKCKWMVNDLWIVCDIEDVMGSGKDGRVWKAVWVSGWDYGHKEYRGAIFDSFGNSSMMRGKLDGRKLIFESMDDVIMHGQPTRLRFTFDSGETNGIKFTAEHTVNGVYVVDEQEIHVATGE